MTYHTNKSSPGSPVVPLYAERLQNLETLPTGTKTKTQTQNTNTHPKNGDVTGEPHAIANRPRSEDADDSEYENHRDENVVRVGDVLLQKPGTRAKPKLLEL